MNRQRWISINFTARIMKPSCIMNDVMLTYRFLRKIGVCVDPFTVRKGFESCPAYGSIRCISDMLDKCGVDNMVCRLSFRRLSEAPLPAIVELDGDFCILSGMDTAHGLLLVEDGKGRKRRISENVFTGKWSGIALLAEYGRKKEPSAVIIKVLFKKVLWLSEKYLPFILAAAVTLSGLICGNISGMAEIAGAVVAVSGLFLSWTAFVKSIHGSGQTGGFCGEKCDDLIRGDGSHILWGSFSLAELALAYFGSSLLYLAMGFPGMGCLLFASLSLVAVFYSLAWQAWHKKPCAVCLSIDAALSAFFWISLWLSYPFAWSDGAFAGLGLFAVIYIAVLLAVSRLYRLSSGDERCSYLKKRLGRFVSSPEVFAALLSRQRRLNAMECPQEGIFLNKVDTDGMEPEHRIFAVLSPGCPFCAKAFGVLEKTVDAKVGLMLIPGNDAAFDGQLIARFVHVSRTAGGEEAMDALHAWFSDRAIPDVIVDETDWEIVETCRVYCPKAGIRNVPAVFVDDHELPPQYSIEDLEYIMP